MKTSRGLQGKTFEQRREQNREHSRELAALLAATRALLENRAFAGAAQGILEACKALLSADVAWIALLGNDGKGFEIALLSSGSLGFSVGSQLPPPLRRLSARAGRTSRTVFANNLARSAANKPHPTLPAVPENALVAPFSIDGTVVGLICLLNKAGGFAAADRQRAGVFAEMVAVAMLHGRTVDNLVTELQLAHETEQRTRDVGLALREATVEITRSLDRETVLTTLLDRLRRFVPFDRASVMLVEEASRVSVRAVFDGRRIVPLAPEMRSEFDATDHPIIYGILITGSPVLISDLRARTDCNLPTDERSAASWMGVPLFARATWRGCFRWPSASRTSLAPSTSSWPRRCRPRLR